MNADAGLFTLLTSTVALIFAVTLLLSVAILLPCVATGTATVPAGLLNI